MTTYYAMIAGYNVDPESGAPIVGVDINPSFPGPDGRQTAVLYQRQQEKRKS